VVIFRVASVSHVVRVEVAASREAVRRGEVAILMDVESVLSSRESIDSALDSQTTIAFPVALLALLGAADATDGESAGDASGVVTVGASGHW